MTPKIKRHELSKFLINRVVKLSRISKDEVLASSTFHSLGLTSLDGVQLVNDLNIFLKTDHSPVILFDYPTISELINFLLNPETVFERKPKHKKSHKTDPIAIIGMACDFPGGKGLEKFWQLLDCGGDAVTEVSSERWKDMPRDFKAWGGFIDSPDEFDHKLFDITASEARSLDPQQRKVLETSWLAIEHSGYAPQSLMGTNTGVYVGISTNDYSLAKIDRNANIDVYDGIGGAHSIAANRVSYCFDFHGPSWAVDTACSSSLVSIAQAVNDLRNGDCDMALAGGVNILYTSHLTQSFDKSGMLSKTGRCRTFSDKADGYVRGEGCGMIVLKRLSDAKRDNDEIWGVIKGVGYNQDGRSNGLTAPNGKAQEAVIYKAHMDSGIESETIDYIEAHGTGTPLGDPIEYEALKNVFKNKKESLYIGSVKTNIGHLEAAAGIASVIKVLLSMKYNKVPKSLHFENLNPTINKEDSPLVVSCNDIPMLKNFRAGISSFGFGGTNAHLILESGQAYLSKIQSYNLYDDQESYLLYIAATNDKKMNENIARLISSIENLTCQELSSFCYYHNKKTSLLNCRKSLTAKNKKSLVTQLQEMMNKKHTLKKKISEQVCFAFTGQGSQYESMHLDLYENNSVFRNEYIKIKEIFTQKYNIDFNDLDKFIQKTDYAQISLFALEYALFKTLEDMGLSADYYLGHSLGEVVAFTCAGGMSLEDAIDLIYFRGRAMEKSPVGAMLVCFLNKSEIEKILTEEKMKISIAAINSESIIVVSGEKEVISQFQKILEQKKIKTKSLPVKNAFHSHLMDCVLDDFYECIKGITYLPTKKPVVSSVTGNILENINHNYWVEQIRKPTNFLSACDKIGQIEVGNIIEIGPHPTLAYLFRENLRNLNFVSCPLNRKKEGYESFLSFSGELFEAGFKLKQEAFFKNHYNWIQTPSTILDDRELQFQKIEALDGEKSNELSYEIVLRDIKKIIADELDYDIDQIDAKQPIMNFGADSLLLLSVLENLREVYGVSISITDVFQSLSNIELITKYILDKSVNDSATQNTDTGKVINIVEEKLSEKETRVHETSKGVLGHFSAKANDSSLSTNINSEVISKLIENFTTKTKSSKNLSQEYRKYLADNRVSAGFRPNLKELVYPIVWKKAKGAYFWDIDGNKFIDFTMGFGVNLFGHSPEFINEQIKEQLNNGMALGPQSNMAGIVAEKFCCLTNNERVAFLNSGTEAIMTSVRLARAYTKREKIVIFEGSYHGHFDGVLGRSNRKKKTVPVAPGVPLSLMHDLVVLDYGCDDALDYIKDNASEIAAVLIEPVQSRYPELQPREFLHKMRALTSEYKITLIFDEVITGLRVGIRGAQNFFEIEADLAAYGKVLGGGMPIGAVAGKKEYLDFIDGGHWEFGDSSMPVNPMTFFAGTFCKHSLAMAASYATLCEIEKRGEDLFIELTKKIDFLSKSLNSYFEKLEIDLRIVNFSSLFRFKYSGNMDLLFYFLNLKGIYIWEGRNLFVSQAHSDTDINDFIKLTKEVVDYLLSVGYIKKKKIINPIHPVRKMQDEHLRFCKMSLESVEGELASKITVGIKVKGAYDATSIKNAIEEVVNQHSSLRATYNLLDNQIKYSQKEIKVVTMNFKSLEHSENAAIDWLESSKKETFNLLEECVDINLLLISEEEAIIAFSAHHIAIDGLSLAMISFDIAHIYSKMLGEKSNKKIKTVDYIDFLDSRASKWEKVKPQMNYWKEQYKEIPPPLFFNKSYHGGRVSLELSLDESNKIKFFGYKNKSSLMNTLLVALLKHLHLKFAKEDFVIGVPFAGHENISDTMVGNCVNLLPFKLSYKNNDYKTLIENIKTYQLKSFRNSEVSYARIKEEIGADVIEIVLNVEPINELPKFKNLKAELITYPSAASEYPIYINAMKVEDIINITLDYQESAFKTEQEALEFLNVYQKILQEIIS